MKINYKFKQKMHNYAKVTVHFKYIISCYSIYAFNAAPIAPA